MRIISWNINGIRAAHSKDFSPWLENCSPDILCVQEIKADLSKIPEEYLKHPDYFSYALPAERKGYSGVMTLSKTKPMQTIYGLRSYKNEGRTLIHIFKKFILINAYFPNGGREHERVDFKLKYCEAILRKVKKLEKDHKKPVIICGDFNTAHHSIDLKNPKTNTKTSGFLPNERAWLDKLKKNGYEDYFRYLHPEEQGHYSWWSYRNNCRERNIGWRIDYFWGNSKVIPQVKECHYMPSVLGSDHCPVLLRLNEGQIKTL